MTETARLELIIDASRAKSGVDNLDKSMTGLLTVTGKVDVSLVGLERQLNAIAISTRATAQNSQNLGAGLSAISLNGQRTAETLARIEQGLSRIALNTQKAASGTRGYSVASGAAKVQTESFGRSLDNLGKKLGVTGGALQRLFVGFSAVYVLRDAAKTIAGFESSLATLRGVTGLGKTSQSFQDIEAQARKLGATTRFTAQDAAEGQLFLARAGFNAQQILAALPATLNLAAAGNIELGQAADLASNAVTQFNLRAGDTARVVDSLVNVSNNSNTNIQQLGEALKFAGPVANAFGVDVETTNAALGKLGDAGIQATLAGTGLRGVLGRLSDPSTEASGVLKKLVGDLDLLDIKSRGLVPVLRTLQEANLDVVDAFQVFGRLQAGPGLILTQTADDIERLVQLQRDGAGAAQDLANIQNDTLQGSFLALRSAIQEAYLATGDAGLAGGLRSVTDAGTGALRILNGTASAAELADKGATALAASLKTVALVSAGLVGIRLFKYLNDVRTAIVAVGAATSASPIGAIATGVVLAGSALYGILSVTNQAADSFRDLEERTTSLADALTELAKARARLENASATDRFSGGIRAELRAVDTVRDSVVGNKAAGIADLKTVKDLAAILDSQALLGSPVSLFGQGAADQVVDATITDLADSFRKKGITSSTDIVNAIFRTGVLDIDNRDKAAKDSLTVRGTSYVDVVPETVDQKTLRGARERARTLRDILSREAAGGADILNPEVLIRSIAEANFEVVRVAAETTLRLVGAKDSALRQLGAAAEKNRADQIRAQTAGSGLTGDIFGLKEQAAADLERATGRQITSVEKYQRAIEKFIAKRKEEGATEEVIAKLRAEAAAETVEIAKKTDDLTAANERSTKAAADAKRIAEQRARAETELAGIIRGQQESVRLATLKTDEQRQLSTNLIAAGNKAIEAGRLLRATEIKQIVDATTALQDLNRERAKEPTLGVTQGAIGDPLNDPINYDTRSIFSLLEGGGEKFRESRDAINDARKALEDFQRSFSDEKTFIQADIEAARIGRPEDADLFRQKILDQRELNELLKATGDLETSAGQAARTSLENSITESARLREQLKQTVEQRRLFEDLGYSGAQAFTDIASGAKSATEAIVSLGQEISRSILQTLVTKPLANLAANGLSSLFGGTNLIPSANGNVFQGGRVIPFARGGVIDSPISFPLAGGTGIAGEAGPEAIMPLVRGPGGKLGVHAVNSGNSTSVTNYNIRVSGGRGRGGGRRDEFGRSDRQFAADLARSIQRAG